MLLSNVTQQNHSELHTTFDKNQNTHSNNSSKKIVEKKWYNFSKFEWLEIGIIIITGIVLSLVLLSLKMDLGNSQQELQNTNSKIISLHNSNNNLKQEIVELQSDGRLKKIAQKQHLSLNNKNIRNVGK